ncbi:DUF3119 family protein [Synechococcus sp. CS-1325]|uniref:DUF3119 family protein n=1 Tax=Synechococcus sp. CS-1325 TaxID=2847979 RepID=UPI00223B1DD8|nr:DUF3119 family protein [Synechococcus sp. CS-1325]MCT0198306.1 DUF3119 family protein [Synechococcus sp. CS-1325]
MTIPAPPAPHSEGTSSPTVGPSPAETTGVILAPRAWVPLGVLLLAGASLLLPRWGGSVWLAGGVGVLGLFLLLQTALLRLQFGEEDLLVWRGNSLLRRFPYQEWLGWTLFWWPLPVLFYFREQRSIHLLPVLFDATALRQQLDLHLSAPR